MEETLLDSFYMASRSLILKPEKTVQKITVPFMNIFHEYKHKNS